MSTYCEFLNPEAHTVSLEEFLMKKFKNVIEEADIENKVEVYMSDEVLEVEDYETSLQDTLDESFPTILDEV